jgi:exodeoxyribonuclease VII large subunit
MQIIDERQVLSVAEVNSIAKEVLETLSFWVEGEIYDFRGYNERHYYAYFQLKDAGGDILPCQMLPQQFKKLTFDLDNGQKVLAHGKLTLYAKRGQFQFLVDTIEHAGEGNLARELEALKVKLQAEGLLGQERKRPLPTFPTRIGVITSVSSDAWADFQRHSWAKFPHMELVVQNVFVQGKQAVSSIVQAIATMQSQHVEVLVLIRGGGSLEDLAAFNDEAVARAIAQSTVPTLVGVGHEKDVSIADLVADVRASTPTNAGQILTKPYEELVVILSQQRQRLESIGRALLERAQQSLHYVADRPVLTDDTWWTGYYRQNLDDLLQQLNRVLHKYRELPLVLHLMRGTLEHHQERLVDRNARITAVLHEKLVLAGKHLVGAQQQRLLATKRQLDLLSPLAVLGRGYSLVLVDDTLVRSSTDVEPGSSVSIQFHHGSATATIIDAIRP